MTSTTVSPAGPLPGWLKSALLAAAVFIVCWGGAIAYWRTAENAPAAGELALALLVAPLGVLMATWVIKKAVLSKTAASTLPEASPATKAVPVAPTVPPLAILATALRSPHGASTEELAAAIAAGKARADLDPELVDNKGFPLTAARRDDAVDEALQEEINEWLALKEMGGLRFSEVQWRALTLGTAVVRDLASEAAIALTPAEGTPPVLQLIPILPAEWTVEHRSATVMWFKHQAAQYGWPAADMTAVDFPIHNGHAISSIFKQLARDAAVPGSRFAALVIACDSQIDQETVDRWDAAGTLFTTSRSQGLIPGEGAAGMLLTDLQHAQKVEGTSYAVLEPFFEARREVSIDDSKRTDTKLLLNLAERACKAATVEPTNVAMIVADTGDRANRMLELMGMASTMFPQLEDSTEVARIGEGSGICGAVPCITALALARHHAIERTAPVLCVSNEDTHQRCTTLIRPATSV
jgi:hypothetical protein